MEKLKPNTNQPYKVVVLAAGKGRRLEEMTADTNKALLPLAFKSVLSHIIEKFPISVTFVLAVGYKKQEIQDYLLLAHPERHFQFVEVDRFEGPGSGPGYSLLCCQKALGDSPFILTTVDTLVLEDIPPPDEDWLGIAPVTATQKYNSVSLEGDTVTNMQDKVECENTHAFIGLCGIRSTELFWRHLKEDRGLVGGELQLSNGLKPLVAQKMRGVPFVWFDTGDKESFNRTSKALDPSLKDNFDFSKRDEFIYFVNGRVIKYFRDETIARQRVERAKRLEGFVPPIEQHRRHFYCYPKIRGQVLYSVLNDGLVEKVLDWLYHDFWKPVSLSPEQRQSFREACKKFYYDKTLQRAELYFHTTGRKDDASMVNGQRVPSLVELFAKVPWESLYEGISGQFHGDLQFDNILVTDPVRPAFLLIDWRQDFGGLMEFGDIYYDLAKLYGGTLLPYDLIKKGLFHCENNGNEIRFSVKTRQSLLRAQEIFQKRIRNYGYDLDKIQLLTALIFINMAPLHTPPFNILLHHLGKLTLHQIFTKVYSNDWLQPDLP